MRRDGSVLEFLYADHTFVNTVLAKHYGIAIFRTGRKNPIHSGKIFVICCPTTRKLFYPEWD